MVRTAVGAKASLSKGQSGLCNIGKFSVLFFFPQENLRKENIFFIILYIGIQWWKKLEKHSILRAEIMNQFLTKLIEKSCASSRVIHFPEEN